MTTLALAENRLRQFLALTKPRVVSLIVFCAVIGMFLASPGLPPAGIVFMATIGIALVAGAAAAVNCLVEQKIDALMQRTRARPLPRGELTSLQTMVFAGMVGGVGLWVLYRYVNPLTMWLSLATFVGYAVIYTVLLKPATPQNIVIGGASGAMPPVLGWAAVANDIAPEALLLFLIIFVWTPPHFWALALYRTKDYARAGLPMLPVTHGSLYTRLQIVLYTFALVGVSMLPFAIRMSGLLYLVSALALGGVFLGYAFWLYFRYSDELARATFRYSIVYLAAIFLGAADRPLLAVMRRAAAFALALIVLAAAMGCAPEGPKFKSSDITGSSFGRDFALTDHTGKPRTLADYRGRAVVVFFGYTQCPDVCPTTLSTLAETMKQLGPDADRVQVIFITVDPERDTQALLAHYVPAFDPRFVGLSGDAAATERVAKEFKIIYQKQPGATPSSYTVDHSAGVYVFDPQGRLRLYMSHGQGPDVFAHDLKALLKSPP